MEPILLLAAAAGAVWLGKKLFQARSRAAALNAYHAAAQRSVENRRARAAALRHEKRRRMQAHARAMQLAILQLSRSPDFQRAASFAAQAKDVPAAFRQRQFRRLRPLLVRHFASRVRAGGDGNGLLESLRELVGALGVPAYEGDYIAQEVASVQAQPAAPPPPQTYAQRLAGLQRDHEQRKAAIEAMTGMERDVQEQLLEQENTRFREALQALGNDDLGRAQP